MTRYTAELHRLFLLPGETTTAEIPLLDAAQQVRTLILSIQPKHLEVLERLMQALQEDFGLMLPALAIHPEEGYQLWISLSTPVRWAEATLLLANWETHYLADIPKRDYRLRPSDSDASSCVPCPPQAFPGDRWSAFIDPSLRALFRDDPWLDMPPALEQQADLLAKVSPLHPQDLWHPASDEQTARLHTPLRPPKGPREFLFSVMNDETQPLPLRIDAAKALLPFIDS